MRDANRPWNVDGVEDLCEVGLERKKFVVVWRFDELIAIMNLLALTCDDRGRCTQVGIVWIAWVRRRRRLEEEVVRMRMSRWVFVSRMRVDTWIDGAERYRGMKIRQG
jgi:hypothetical protein